MSVNCVMMEEMPRAQMARKMTVRLWLALDRIVISEKHHYREPP
jgi:hypothetical protein